MSLFGGFGASNNQTTGATGGGLFGNNQQQQQQQQQQPSLFGGGAATGGTAPLSAQATQPVIGAPQQATGGGLFGNTGAQNTGGGGGLFGSTANTGTTGGLFGNTASNAQQQQQQQQQPAQTGGLFGNTQNTGGTTGGLFGSTNQNAGNAGGGLLGNAQNTTNSNTTGTTGGLFGSTAGGGGGGLFGGNNAANQNQNQQQQQPANTGGLFGSTNNQQQQQQQQGSGGLFGSTAGTNQPAAGGNLFGSTANNQASGGLFGSKPATGGLFGSTNTGATNNAGGGLFGNQQQQQQPQQQQQGSGGLFGSQAVQPNNNGGLFGNKSTLGTSALGQPGPSASTLLGSKLGGGASQNQGENYQQKIEAVYNAWNPSSPQCRFQYPFYNLVDPNQVNLYGRPPNALNDAVWEKAVKENPDRTCFVPVVAIGFDDLRERVEAQSKQSTDHTQKLTDLSSRLSALQTKHKLTNTSRLQKATLQQAQITHRLLKLIQHMHLLIPNVRSSSIRPEEEELRGKLEEVEEELRRGRMKAKLNELWALLGAVMAGIEKGRGSSGGEWAVVDEEGMSQIVQVLKDQQMGLAHLTSILQKDQKDLAVVMGTTNAEELELKEGENLWNSTATLRASHLR